MIQSLKVLTIYIVQKSTVLAQWLGQLHHKIHTVNTQEGMIYFLLVKKNCKQNICTTTHRAFPVGARLLGWESAQFTSAKAWVMFTHSAWKECTAKCCISAACSAGSVNTETACSGAVSSGNAGFSMHLLPWVYSLSSYGDIVHSAIDTGQNKIIAAHTFTEGRIQNTIDVFKDPKLMFLKYTHGVLWGRYKLKLWSWLNFRQLSIKMLEWMKSKSMLSNNGVKRLSSINWNISCEQKLQVKVLSHIPQDDSAYVYWV